MTKNLKQILLERLAKAIQDGHTALANGTRDYSSVIVKYGDLARFRSGGFSIISSIYGKDHSYYKEFTAFTNQEYGSNTEAGIAILQNITTEVDNDWTTSFKGLITAEIFSDFLDMADHLLAKGYKDPAAVMIGSVLEEHIRQLCLKHHIPITSEKDGKPIALKAERLNQDLAKAEVYTVLEQKNITAQLDLRNRAAHGQYETYVASDVKMMSSYVLNFLSKYQL